MDDNHTSFSFLTKGSQVEVTSDKDGLTGPWFVATVIHPPPSISSSNNLVYVEYHNLLTDASSSTRLREYANVAYVRPSPVNSGSVSFQLNDVVDAFCRDGWWTGVISSVLEDDKFEVTFQNPPYQIRIHISDLRVHRKWVGGKWVQPQNQGDTEGRTLMDRQRQREQTTPDIQSTVETSRMKRTKKQTNLDTGMISCTGLFGGSKTDGVSTQKFCVQTIWKNWENTQRQLPSNYNSHGKTVCGKRGKTEQKTPPTGSSKKREKLSVELKSLQASEEGTRVDSGKSRSQEKTPNGMGRMAVSQRKLLQKFTVVDKEGRQGDAASVNTSEAPAQDSKEKGDGILEKYSTTKSPEHTRVTVNGPDATVEQSSIQLQFESCDMDVENLPFVKSVPLWKIVESMEVFQKIPQRPHFRPLLEGVDKNAREETAIGKMMTFKTVVEKTYRLKYDDPKSTIEDSLETLIELERYGFEVAMIRERLAGLLSLKNKQDVLDEHAKGVAKKLEKHKIRGNKIDDEIAELEEKQKQAMLKKGKNKSEIGVMIETAEKIKEEMKKVGKEFDELAAARF